MSVQTLLLPAFRQFIHDSYSGKRLQKNGQPIRRQTVDNYVYVYKLLEEFEQHAAIELRIRSIAKMSKRQLNIEKNYWKKFYLRFVNFLHKEKNCYDNYVGNVIKIIRVFFNYLNKEKLIFTGDFFKSFYIKREEVPIITLQPAQLQFLIEDDAFGELLPAPLARTKDVFIFGCTVALRFCDLFNIRFRDIEQVNGSYYLFARSQKTDVPTRVKLPAYAIAIVRKYQKRKSPASRVFPLVSMRQFNHNIRAIGERAGWTGEVGKSRNKNGVGKEMYKVNSRQAYRFCDLMTSHTMRRTAITTMLMLGMPEHIVRKISGHAANSASFHRYVNFVQSYLDSEIDKVHDKLLQRKSSPAMFGVMPNATTPSS